MLRSDVSLRPSRAIQRWFLVSRSVQTDCCARPQAAIILRRFGILNVFVRGPSEAIHIGFTLLHLHRTVAGSRPEAMMPQSGFGMSRLAVFDAFFGGTPRRLCQWRLAPLARMSRQAARTPLSDCGKQTARRKFVHCSVIQIVSLVLSSAATERNLHLLVMTTPHGSGTLRPAKSKRLLRRSRKSTR